ncbi:hypothetical protein ACIRBX_22555 [Kitasatospora sp. NPDC096147]|uniref:hypothetical protein n=1 Tax=Kitasatospora sp. NPDC096147 TaxID=3364093 RepID=UPI003819F6BD
MTVWEPLAAAVEARLIAASSGERAVFAAGVAERLLASHEALPAHEHDPFTLSLRPLLEHVWAGALGDATASRAVRRGVAEIMLGDHGHHDGPYGPYGPRDEHEPAAAAVLDAAHAHLFGCRDFASWVSGHAVAALDHDPDGAEWPDHEIPGIDEAIATELRRQVRDLDLIATCSTQLHVAGLGLFPSTAARLGDALRTPLSRPA